MQQWIPKGHTLEPKIWGEIGLRQGLYLAVGILLGALLFFAFSRFGLWVRIGALALPPILGLIVGFLKIKGLTPEQYLFHRLRFRLRRAGRLGVWDVGTGIGSPGGIRTGEIASAPQTVATKTESPRRTPTPVRARPAVSSPRVYLMEAGPFGILFTAAAWAVAGMVLAYTARGLFP